MAQWVRDSKGDNEWSKRKSNAQADVETNEDFNTHPARAKEQAKRNSRRGMERDRIALRLSKEGVMVKEPPQREAELRGDLVMALVTNL